MTTPYQLVAVHGNIVFAARGSSIHTFTSELQHISTWKYPAKQESGTRDQSPAPEASPAPEPPSKRRKLGNGQEQAPSNNGEAKEVSTPESKGRKREKIPDPPPERPFVHGLSVTTDGRHVVAITGSDKTIWVLEHDGAGHLKQLSQRIMPKRPCAVVITPDNQNILSGDKFGDVYSLPLIPSSTPENTTPAPLSRSATPSTTQPFKPQANEFTVHTRRNLKALENQKLGLATQVAKRPVEAQFEHTLLLGHVSLLTSILLATHPVTKRPYIITGDRDEHIRVSRGHPSQAHIIENFCQGHEDFVSRLCIPSSRPELLISGGGDDHLFIWDWFQGRMLSKTSILEHVQKVVPEATKLAVSKLYAFPISEEAASTLVFVICERVPAIFCFILQQTSLHHSATIPVRGNPLDLTLLDAAPRLLVALHPEENASQDGELSSLLVMERDAVAGWQVNADYKVSNVPGDEIIKPEELSKIIYTTENLRKSGDFE